MHIGPHVGESAAVEAWILAVAVDVVVAVAVDAVAAAVVVATTLDRMYPVVPYPLPVSSRVELVNSETLQR